MWRQARYYAKEYCWRITHREGHKTAEIMARKRNQAAKIFVVLMQKPGDAQLRVHSPYFRNRPFYTGFAGILSQFTHRQTRFGSSSSIPTITASSACRAFFRALATKLGIEDRAYYLRKTSIDIVLDNADGLITVNSTGGLTAVVRGLPVMCCGNAIFNMAGLTFQEGLDRFWKEASPPARRTVKAFVNYLLAHSQLNGGFPPPGRH